MNHDEITWSSVKKGTLKPLDSWWNIFFIDHLVTPLMYVLLKLNVRITPNQVTILSLLFGLASAYFFAESSWVWAGLLYQVSFILDCVDGRLARFRKLTGEYGAFFDGFVNYLVYGACVAGIALSDLTNYWMVLSCLLLLVIRTNACFINEILERPNSGTWSHFVAPEDSWMTKMRLLPPGSFPDKHALLFLVAPVFGYALWGVILNVALEGLLLLVKWKKVRKQLLADDED